MNRTALPIFVLLFLMLMENCKESTPAGAAKENAAGGQDTVAVFLLGQKKVIKKMELPAELLPYEQADLAAKVEGYVKAMKVDIGDRVRKGQELALIEAPEVNTRYAEFQNALLAAKAKYHASLDNYQRLFRASQASSPGIVAPVDLEKSRQQMLADSASYSASEKLAQSYKEVSGYLIVKAPFDGVVTARKADPGDLVSQNTLLVSVQNNSVLRLRVAVPEIYVSSGAASDTVQFKTDAFPEQSFQAKLTRKTESIDPVTRTEIWEYDYRNDKKILKAGAFAYVQLKIERKSPSFVVPFPAVASTQERKFVIRVSQGKTEWVDARPGITLDEGLEIFGNLHPGDTLLTRASDERKPGTSAFWKLK